MSKSNKQRLRNRSVSINVRQKSSVTKSFINILLSKLKVVVRKTIKNTKYFSINNEEYGIISDMGTAFIAITASTVMRMGYGIFEYSSVSLLINGLVYSLVTGSIFIKTKITMRDRKNLSNALIGKIFVVVAATNVVVYPFLTLMDRQRCLSSSIMFINLFVFIGLMLVPYAIFRQRSISDASDILIGNPKHVLGMISKNNFKTSGFNPTGLILTDKTDCGGNFPIPLLGLLSNVPLILQSFEENGIIPKRFVIIDPIPSDKEQELKGYAAQHGIILLQLFGSEIES